MTAESRGASGCWHRFVKTGSGMRCEKCGLVVGVPGAETEGAVVPCRHCGTPVADGTTLCASCRAASAPDRAPGEQDLPGARYERTQGKIDAVVKKVIGLFSWW